MADSIFVRVQRVVASNLDTAIDAAERASSTSLMREAIREIDRAIDRTLRDHEAAVSRRVQTEQQQALASRQRAQLEDDARFALGKGRDDLARAAVTRQIEIEDELERLKSAATAAAAEAARIEENLAALRLRKGQMQQDLAAFQSAQQSAAAATGAAGSAAQRQAARAQESFDRAMAAAGGVTREPTSPDTAAKVAEINQLKRVDEIEARLAALQAKAAPKVKAASKAKARG